MNNQITFASGLKEYIYMALQIWPALQLCLRNLQDTVKPTKDSLLPQKNYNTMTNQQFIEEITESLHTYVMQHDVKAEHIQEYLVDILIIFNTEEQNPNTIRFMSRELEGLIEDMQQQRYQRLFQLRQLYSQMKNITLQHQQEGNSDDQQQNSDEEPQYFEGEVSQQTPNNQKQEKVPQLTEQQKSELEDDGWCVVPSKKKRK